jgi:hypothetical protein
VSIHRFVSTIEKVSPNPGGVSADAFAPVESDFLATLHDGDTVFYSMALPMTPTNL